MAYITVFCESPESVEATIGSEARFFCSVKEKYRIVWEILLLSNTAKVTTDQPAVLAILMEKGIIVESPNATSSFLVISNVTDALNITTVQCTAVDIEDAFIRQSSEEVHLNITCKFIVVGNIIPGFDFSIGAYSR